MQLNFNFLFLIFLLTGWILIKKTCALNVIPFDNRLEDSIPECIIFCESTRGCQSIIFNDRTGDCGLYSTDSSTEILMEENCGNNDYSEPIQGNVNYLPCLRFIK